MPELGYKGGKSLVVTTNAKSHSDSVGDVPGVDGTAVDDFETAGFF